MEVDTLEVSGKRRSQLFTTPHTLKQAKLPVGSEQHCQLPGVGFQRQGSFMQTTEIREGCREEVACWILKDEEKFSGSRESKFPKQRQCKKSTQRNVSGDWLFQWQRTSCVAGMRGVGENTGME